MEADAPDEATSWFKRGWEDYQRVLDGNYLEHKVLYSSAASVLAQQRRSAGRPLRLLDLGCGDADYICRTLSDLAGASSAAQEQDEDDAAAGQQQQPLLHSYTGVDLSSPALAIAKTYLAKALHACTAMQLHLDDMLAWVQQQDEGAVRYDVVLISFALHHLEADKKLQLLARARQLLSSSGGVLMLIDVFRRPEESLGVYMSRFVADVDTTWTQLDDYGRNVVKEHVTSFDLPESVPTYQELSEKACFKRLTVMAEGAKDFSKLLVFQA